MSNANGMHWIRDERRFAIYARDNHCCVYCGSTDNLTLDHVWPRDLGGGNESGNLVTACLKCNSGRVNLRVQKWAKTLPDPKGVMARVRKALRTPVDMKVGKAMLAAKKAAKLGIFDEAPVAAPEVAPEATVATVAA